jgi:MFS family permease
MARADIGLAYGLIALVAGLTGSVTAGRLATALLRRGWADATLRLCTVAAVVMAPLSIAMALAPSASAALLLLAPVTFFMAWPPGLSVAALQAVTPSDIRGRIIGLYLVITNFLSFTLGPLLVGFLNDAVFPGRSGIGFTLAALAAVAYPLAALCLWTALKPFRTALELARTWE